MSCILVVKELKNRKKILGMNIIYNFSSTRASQSVSSKSRSTSIARSLIYFNKNGKLSLNYGNVGIDENRDLNNNFYFNQTNCARLHKTQIKATRNIIALVIVFFVSWFPYVLLTISIQFVPDIYKHLNISVAIIPPMFAKTSAIVNPIIYALKNSRFRVLLKRMLSDIFRKFACKNTH